MFGTTELSTLVLGSPCRSCVGSKFSCTSCCQNKPLDLGTGSAALESHESPCNAKSTIFSASLPVSRRDLAQTTYSSEPEIMVSLSVSALINHNFPGLSL